MPNATTLPLGDLAQKFLCSKKQDCDNGELSPRTYADYCRTMTLFTSAFGKERDVSGLGPADFEQLYRLLASRHGILALSRDVTMIRTACKYFTECCDVPPMRFGSKFRPPTKLAKRRVRNHKRSLYGPRLFESEELRRLINNSHRHLRAMILLGINCGFGNTDCATLPKRAVDLERGWIDFPRPKTAIARHIPLWEETKRALHTAILTRWKPKLAEDGKLVFVTRYGSRWIRAELKDDNVLIIVDSVSQAFKTLLKALNIYRPGLSFYTLRHVFETIAGETGDQVAVDAIMGHVDGSMAETYREKVSEERLIKVTQHVHDWLYRESA